MPRLNRARRRMSQLRLLRRKKAGAFQRLSYQETKETAPVIQRPARQLPAALWHPSSPSTRRDRTHSHPIALSQTRHIQYCRCFLSEIGIQPGLFLQNGHVSPSWFGRTLFSPVMLSFTSLQLFKTCARRCEHQFHLATSRGNAFGGTEGISLSRAGHPGFKAVQSNLMPANGRESSQRSFSQIGCSRAADFVLDPGYHFGAS